MKGVCRMSFPPTNLVLRTIKLLPEQAHRVAHLECFWHILNTFLMFSLKLWKLLTIMAYFIRWNHYYYTTGPFPLLESYLIYRSVMVVMRGERSNIKSVCAFFREVYWNPFYILCSLQIYLVLMYRARFGKIRSVKNHIEISVLVMWPNRGNLSINEKKSQHCNFSMRGLDSWRNYPTIFLSAIRGFDPLILNKRLTWKQHITKIQ